MADDRTHLTPASEAWMSARPASAAVRAGDLVFLSGQASVTDDGRVTDPGDAEAQARNAFARTRAVLEEAGAGMDDVLDVMTFHKDPRTMDAVFAAGREAFAAPYPAWTALGMVGGHDPGIEVVVRVIAHAGSGEKEAVSPAGFGWMQGLPLSPACRKGDYLFTSGIVGADDAGAVVAPADHMAQARFCYDRLKDVMRAAGGSLDDIVDMICFNHDARGMDAAVDTWCNETVAGIFHRRGHVLHGDRHDRPPSHGSGRLLPGDRRLQRGPPRRAQPAQHPLARAAHLGREPQGPGAAHRHLRPGRLGRRAEHHRPRRCRLPGALLLQPDPGRAGEARRRPRRHRRDRLLPQGPESLGDGDGGGERAIRAGPRPGLDAHRLHRPSISRAICTRSTRSPWCERGRSHHGSHGMPRQGETR